VAKYQDPTADTGTRILVKLSGYPSGTTIYVPDAIVGNSGSLPTSSGAFASSINPGQYAPNSNQLLLVRVNGADATGNGGTLAFGAPATTTTFSTTTQIALNGGVAYVVYEVVDSNPAVEESAQIPIFESSAPFCSASSSTQPSYTVSLAPVSTVSIATQTDPIPRFIAVTPGSDCQQIGDCNSSYYPRLSVAQTSLSISGASLGPKVNGYIQEGNSGSGILPFQTSITYQSGSNWLTIYPSSGVVNTNLDLVADPSALAPGTYQATVTINAGIYGSASVPVTFTVGPPGVTVQNIVNAASWQAGSIAPGSIAAIFGLNLAGANPQVLFNGVSGTVLYDGSSQINVLVPASLGTAAPVSVIVLINGLTSNTSSLTLTPNAPAIFASGILDQNNSVNSASAPEVPGNYIQIFLTGLASPTPNPVTVNIGSQTGLTTAYAGPAPGINGLEQVNVQIPPGLTVTGNSVPLAVCIPAAGGQQQCSPTVTLYLP
jgi:uncharacterized protein (TIGR03437 family)